MRVFLLLCLFCLLCLLALRPQSELAGALPQDGVLGQQVAFFERHSNARLMALEITGESLDEAALFLDQALPELDALGARLAQSTDPSAAASFANRVHDSLPVLIHPQSYPEIARKLSPEAISQRLQAMVSWLRRPGNEFAAPAVFRDFLGLAEEALAASEDLVRSFGQQAENYGAYLMHPERQHLLAVLQVDFAPSDSSRAGPLLDHLLGLAAQAEAEGMEMRVVGSYRHFVDNDRRILADLLLTLPISLLAVALVLWSLFASWKVIAVLHLPALAAMLGGLAGVVLWYAGSVPLMILAFSPALIGISVDYGIHMARACQGGHSRRLKAPLLISWASTASAFLALGISSFPLLAGMGLLIFAGLSMALMSSLLLLPRLIPVQASPPRWRLLCRAALALGHRQPTGALVLGVVLTLAAIPGFLRLQWAADLQVFDASSPATQADLKAVAQRWGRLEGSDFLVLYGQSWQQVTTDLADLAEDLGPAPAALALLLPDAEQQAKRLKAWNAFWQAEHADLAQTLEQVSQELGLSAAAFAPSLQRYQVSSPNMPLIEEAGYWQGSPLHELLQQFIERSDQGWWLNLPLQLDDQEALSQAEQRLEQVDRGFIASRRILAQAHVERLQGELLWLLFWMGTVMVLMVCLCLRSLRQGLIVAAIPLLGALWSFGLLGWTGHLLTPMHLLICAFACGIGIDDAVFYRQASQRSQSIAPLLATTVSSCLALAALLFAQHPAIRAVAIAVLSCLFACLFACLLLLPALSRLIPCKDAAALPDACAAEHD